MPIQRLDKRSGNGERIKGYILQCLLACHRLFYLLTKIMTEAKQNLLAKIVWKLLKTVVSWQVGKLGV